MKRKGFTLIELLAVIVVLGIIMLIAVTAVNGVITKSRLSSFNTSSEMLEKAASTYINTSNTIVASGSTTTILYSDLKSSGFMERVVDPISKNECTNSRVYVTNTNGTYTYKGALACDNYMDIDSYNLVINGDFSNGTTGWTTTNSTLAVSTNILSSTGNGASNFTTISNTTTANWVSNDKIYVRTRARVTNNTCNTLRLKLWSTGGGSIETYQISTPTQNQWYILSTVYALPSSTGTLNISIYASYTDAATANGKIMQVDGTSGFYTINLTAIYGAGNEPTTAQMDKIMSNMGK